MRSFDTRAMENIATAPASRDDRRAAAVVAAAVLALFVVAIPFGRVQLGEVSAFLPAVVGAAVVAMTLTALLLFVQYRIERDAKLAMLAIAYAAGASAHTLYLLTFPQLFSRTGLFGAGQQTAAWWYAFAHFGFAAFVVAQAVAGRPGWRLPRNAVRTIAAAAVAGLVALAFVLGYGHAALPAFVDDHARFTALWAGRLAPLLALFCVGGAVLVAGRLSTVAQVWLAVVLLTRAADIVTATDLGGTRFSLGWYLARIDTLIGAIVVLGVFLVKINELMLRLAARSRSTAEALEVGEARYASLANVVPQLIWTTNDKGDVEYVNDRWFAYTGCDVNATRDGGWRASADPDLDAQVRERWQQSLSTGEPFAAEVRLREGKAGRYRWFLVNAVPARGRSNEIVAWIGTCTDVDPQKRLEEREAFLSRAGERLGASLAVTATVTGIETLLIPRLAERTWVALLDDNNRYVLTSVSGDAIDELDVHRRIGTVLQPALHESVAGIVAAGEPSIVDRPGRFLDPWGRQLPAGAAMIVPLVSGDTRIGALALVRDADRPYDADDVALVREFARRAALSLEHARLYERERSTADALQRAMLPAQLPILPGIRFSASYSAASESQRVGGDFYDAFELPDGRVALTIGDVTGHGLEAAVIMGEIRQALRAASFESAEPSAILDRASRLLVASGRSVFVTAIVGVFDPVTGHFTYATAGHPAPLLDHAGELRRLQSAGLPIGLRDDEGVDFAVRLHAPCTLVMFTDGLMEFARDLDDGERRIESAIRELAREDIDHLAAALMTQVLGEDEPTDDIAILTVTIDRFEAEAPGDAREWRFNSSDGRTGAMIRREIGDLMSAWTGRADVQFGSELAFGEMVANAVRHAPGFVRVVAATAGGGRDAMLSVEDGGAGFTAGTHRIDPYAESGRGLNLIRAVADDLVIAPGVAGGTRVAVTFRSAEVAALVASA